MALINVTTKYGPVIGVETAEGSLFKGVPYAAPPTGSRRFAAPETPEAWAEPLICDKWPADTFRLDWASSPRFQPKESEPHTCSEDCLYANIWTPAKEPDEGLPVMLWLYGAGGTSHDSAVDGAAINRHGCILITINYRIDIFGYFSLPEFVEKDPHGSSGCYGIMDIVQALKWLRENIQAFGGDPENITVFGHSAGAMFTKLLLGCRPARGLFKRVISLSGAGITDIDPVYSKEEKYAYCQRLLDMAGWTAEDMMVRPANEIYKTLHELEPKLEIPKKSMLATLFLPSVDDWLITDYYGKVLMDGDVDESADVMCGMLGEEWHNFAVQVPGGLKGFEREFAAAPVLAWGERYLERGIKPVYTYFFERPMPGNDGMMRHGDELPYVFGTLDRFDKQWSNTDRKLSETVIGYFTSFAKNGVPYAKSFSEWMPYEETSRSTMVFGSEKSEMQSLIEDSRMKQVVDYMLENPGMMSREFDPQK